MVGHLFIHGFSIRLFLVALALTLAVSVSAQDCAHEVVPSIPFTASGSTCGAGNGVGLTNPCGAWFVSGEDYVYEFTTTTQTCVQVELSNYTPGAAGAILTTQCPTQGGGVCVSSAFSDPGSTSLNLLAITQPNTTYYLTISTDTWSAQCTDFDLTIGTNCPPYTAGDCFGALNLCDGYLYQEIAPSDDGLYPDILPQNGCGMSNVANEGWYIINVQEDGILNFSLTPDGTDDYDWVLFNLTNANCNDISTNPDLVVGCNSHGLFGTNGPTGISSAEGGTGTANGPGNALGPPFNADLNVMAGEIYALMISNWSATSNGYTLDFTASTADFEDTTPPVVEDIFYDCEGVHVLFSEYIDCNTILPEHFLIEGPGGPYTVTNLVSNCTQGAAFSAHFLAEIEPGFSPSGGAYSLIFEGGNIANLCGNLLEPAEISFPVAPGMEINADVFPIGCGSSTGTIEVLVENGVEPLLYGLDGGSFQSSPIFSNVPVGIHGITVRDAGGCQGEITVEMWEENLSFSPGTVGFTCDNTLLTNATLPDGFTGTWSATAEVDFGNVHSPQTIATVTESGIYDLVWTVENEQNCALSKVLTVSFSNMDIGTALFTPASCHGSCDGEFTFIPSGAANPNALDYSWSSGTPEPEAPHVATGLCAGIHTVTVQSDSGCVFQMPFAITEPEEISLQEITVVSESCPGYGDASIEIIAQNVVAYSFDGGETFGAASSRQDLLSGHYFLQVRDDQGCVFDTSVFINPTAGPTAIFEASPQVAYLLDPEFQFANYSRDYVFSHWEFGYPDGLGFSDLDEPRFTFPNDEPGDYLVALVVIDGKGCMDTTYRNVGVRGGIRYYIPNAFTPNGDGINDVFKPVLSNIEASSYHLQIFNRLGHLVFESRDIDEGWRGDANGNEYYSGTAVFTYRITVRAADTKDVEIINGSVTTVR